MKKEEDVHLMLIYEIHSEEVCIHTEVCAVEISVCREWWPFYNDLYME